MKAQKRQNQVVPMKRKNLLDCEKELFTVKEVSSAFAKKISVSENAATIRIYRAINSGTLRSARYLGAMRIPRAEVERLMTGEFL